jgi:hypothetical protein
LNTIMSHKRKATETADESHDTQKPYKKNRFHDKHRGQHPKFKGNARGRRGDDEDKTSTIGALKKRARDLRRLLEHVDNEPKHKMPANVRVERERELEACEHELEEQTAAAREADRRRKMISKYHHIRFFGTYHT